MSLHACRLSPQFALRLRDALRTHLGWLARPLLPEQTVADAFGSLPGKQLTSRCNLQQLSAGAQLESLTCVVWNAPRAQGCTLASSGLPIRIEFSRNPFGKRLPLHMPMMQPMHQYVARPIALY